VGKKILYKRVSYKEGLWFSEKTYYKLQMANNNKRNNLFK